MVNFNSIEEAISRKDELNSEIEKILNKDLEVLDKEERSIGRWFGLLGKDKDYSKTAIRLDELQSELVDVQNYISSRKTVSELPPVDPEK